MKPNHPALEIYSADGRRLDIAKASEAVDKLSKFDSGLSLSNHQEGLEVILEAAEKEKQSTARLLSRESDPGLCRRYSEAYEECVALEQKAEEVIQELGGVEKDLRRHWADFVAGDHPQSHQFLFVASLYKVPSKKLVEDFATFTQAVLMWREQHFTVGETLRRRDRKYLQAFHEFELGKHPLQETIRRAAEHLGVDLEDQDYERRYRAFASVMKEKRILKTIEAAVEARDPFAEVDKLDNDLQETLSTVATMQAERSELLDELGRAREDITSLQESFSQLQEQYQHERSSWQHAQQIHREEVVRTASNEALARQTELERRRSGIIEGIKTALKSAGVGKIGRPFRFHNRYGILIAEARRRLSVEMQAPNSEWKVRRQTDSGLLKLVDETLNFPESEELFLGLNGRNLIQQLNDFFQGSHPLQTVFSAAQSQHRLVRWAQTEGFSGTTQLVEAWLSEFRAYQDVEWNRFTAGSFRCQEVVEKTFGTSLLLQEWRNLWDENPSTFLREKSAFSL